MMTSKGATRSEVINPTLPRKSSKLQIETIRTETDTGGQVENT